ncbi:MAG: cyclic pyranopterin monophosphate synthase MoaC [Planctomycetes bacterium]|nr:cyclic pyranopterin monophosphate synthase MoaC [Planctomycetota bacterium]
MDRLSHVNEHGKAKMVDVSRKRTTARKAAARAQVRMKPSTLKRIRENDLEKGDVLSTARIAGIMAAKNTPSLIPLCHPLPLSSVSVEFSDNGKDCINITAKVRVTAQTGVEMEALTAAAAAALTIYDMCKAVDRGMVIEEVCLIVKSGGRSGTYRRSG